MLNDYQKKYLWHLLEKAISHLFVYGRAKDSPFGYDQLEDAYCKVSGKVAFPDGCEPEIQAWLHENEDESVGDNKLLHPAPCDEGWYINGDALPAGAKLDRLKKTGLPAAAPKKKARRVVRIIGRAG